MTTILCYPWEIAAENLRSEYPHFTNADTRDVVLMNDLGCTGHLRPGLTSSHASKYMELSDFFFELPIGFPRLPTNVQKSTGGGANDLSIRFDSASDWLWINMKSQSHTVRSSETIGG